MLADIVESNTQCQHYILILMGVGVDDVVDDVDDVVGVTGVVA